MNLLTRILVILAILVTAALVAVVVFAFSQSAPRSVPVFILLFAVPLAAVLWMFFRNRQRPQADANESPSTHAQD